MRGWILLFALLLTGCFELGPIRLDFNDDPCPGHASSGLFNDSDCMCPLIENLGPNIEGQPCWPAITCSAGWFRSCTCGFAGAGEPLRWSCGGTFDLSVPDLSPPADLLALPDSGATD